MPSKKFFLLTACFLTCTCPPVAFAHDFSQDTSSGVTVAIFPTKTFSENNSQALWESCLTHLNKDENKADALFKMLRTCATTFFKDENKDKDAFKNLAKDICDYCTPAEQLADNIHAMQKACASITSFALNRKPFYAQKSLEALRNISAEELPEKARNIRRVLFWLSFDIFASTAQDKKHGTFEEKVANLFSDIVQLTPDEVGIFEKTCLRSVGAGEKRFDFLVQEKRFALLKAFCKASQNQRKNFGDGLKYADTMAKLTSVFNRTSDANNRPVEQQSPATGGLLASLGANRGMAYQIHNAATPMEQAVLFVLNTQGKDFKDTLGFDAAMKQLDDVMHFMRNESSNSDVFATQSMKDAWQTAKTLFKDNGKMQTTIPWVVAYLGKEHKAGPNFADNDPLVQYMFQTLSSCATAYDGPNGMSCGNGIKERFLGEGLQGVMPEAGSLIGFGENVKDILQDLYLGLDDPESSQIFSEGETFQSWYAKQKQQETPNTLAEEGTALDKHHKCLRTAAFKLAVERAEGQLKDSLNEQDYFNTFAKSADVIQGYLDLFEEENFPLSHDAVRMDTDSTERLQTLLSGLLSKEEQEALGSYTLFKDQENFWKNLWKNKPVPQEESSEAWDIFDSAKRAEYFHADMLRALKKTQIAGSGKVVEAVEQMTYDPYEALYCLFLQANIRDQQELLEAFAQDNSQNITKILSTYKKTEETLPKVAESLEHHMQRCRDASDEHEFGRQLLAFYRKYANAKLNGKDNPDYNQAWKNIMDNAAKSADITPLYNVQGKTREAHIGLTKRQYDAFFLALSASEVCADPTPMDVSGMPSDEPMEVEVVKQLSLKEQFQQSVEAYAASGKSFNSNDVAVYNAKPLEEKIRIHKMWLQLEQEHDPEKHGGKEFTLCTSFVSRDLKNVLGRTHREIQSKLAPLKADLSAKENQRKAANQQVPMEIDNSSISEQTRVAPVTSPALDATMQAFWRDETMWTKAASTNPHNTLTKEDTRRLGKSLGGYNNSTPTARLMDAWIQYIEVAKYSPADSLKTVFLGYANEKHFLAKIRQGTSYVAVGGKNGCQFNTEGMFDAASDSNKALLKKWFRDAGLRGAQKPVWMNGTLRGKLV